MSILRTVRKLEVLKLFFHAHSVSYFSRTNNNYLEGYLKRHKLKSNILFKPLSLYLLFVAPTDEENHKQSLEETKRQLSRKVSPWFLLSSF